jgi:hypothetical protein
MADIKEKPDAFPSVPLIQPGWKIKGGAEDAAANLQAVALTQRTAHLKKQQDEIKKLLLGGIKIIGRLVNEDALDTIDTSKLSMGDGYFVDGAIFLWNGKEWVSSGSLKADPVDLAEGVSTDPGNILRLGEDGKLYVSFDTTRDLLSIYNAAKE